MARVLGIWGAGSGVLSVGGLGACAQDVLEPLAEWFYSTKYISLLSLAFRDLKRRNFRLVYCTQLSLSSLITPLWLPDYWN